MAGNHAYCNTCGKTVPAEREVRDGQVWLVKNCDEHGRTETVISGDSERYLSKAELDDAAFKSHSCNMECIGCAHKRPNLVFIDITNRCNQNCPICMNNTPSMGFLFEPPLEYFEKIFKDMGEWDPKPAIQLFGGEPTVRKDLLEIVDMARGYGFQVRITTNGQTLANKELAEQLAKKRVTFLLSYDGNNPLIYKDLRGTDKILDKKHQAIDNITSIKGTKMILMSLVSKGYNEDLISETIQYCHERRPGIRGIYFMPLAHCWDENDFNFHVDRITTEDVENQIDSAYPDDRVDFIPAGFPSQLTTIMKYLKVKPLPFRGAHPNCESMHLMISDGTQYLPASRFLKGSVLDLAHAFLEAEQKFAKKVATIDETFLGKILNEIGKREGYLRLRAHMTLARITLRQARIGTLVKGKNALSKFGHAAAFILGLVTLRRTRKLIEKHANMQGVLQVLVLPYEDKGNMEGERLARCPTAFAYYNPTEDRVQRLPVCIWQFHKTRIMREISDAYEQEKAAV